MNSGTISVAAFLISLFVYTAWFFNENLFSNSAMIVAILLPLIGIVAALFAKNRSLKAVGLIGNSLVFVLAVIIPFLSTLFWSTP
ncbi:hypothetical protein KQ939_00060 [Planococcus sp. CP5-4]|uniref:hypothetical protein n=1 Tax=unclassified Planococcus (in: firmicutes) TaxID=2662419 RepID=UPI001C229ACE|nr:MULTISPECIES: hypothetical protein [unclassified Planococcus (in: firmicutes)]MBU9675183.1 hypothetical protein [Planococcus sp. CP5-4_YE]MBV0910695.1 hypothetical protein [Planococcus sp. CP5-4_UN]MBW6062094.1 hypothetical protein [Planococcus sp. CP5-4]